MNKETASTMIRAMRDSARKIAAWLDKPCATPASWAVTPSYPVAAAHARGMADAYTIVLGMLADDVVDGPWASVMGPARSALEDQ